MTLFMEVGVVVWCVYKSSASAEEVVLFCDFAIWVLSVGVKKVKSANYFRGLDDIQDLFIPFLPFNFSAPTSKITYEPPKLKVKK